MARPLRIEYGGGFYHVTTRGDERKDIFKNNRDRGKFLEYLASAVERYKAKIHVYCLMNNHYHLLTSKQPFPESAGDQWQSCEGNT